MAFAQSSLGLFDNDDSCNIHIPSLHPEMLGTWTYEDELKENMSYSWKVGYFLWITWKVENGGDCDYRVFQHLNGELYYNSSNSWSLTIVACCDHGAFQSMVYCNLVYVRTCLNHVFHVEAKFTSFINQQSFLIYATLFLYYTYAAYK